jgi:hypothetical protein
MPQKSKLAQAALRLAALSILQASRTNPSIAVMIFHPLLASMQHMLRLAHLENKGTRGTFNKYGCFLAYQIILSCWKSDKTSDLAKTMSMTDRILSLGGKLSQFIEKT